MKNAGEWEQKKNTNPAKNNTNLYLSFGTPQLTYNQTLQHSSVEIDVCVHTNSPNVFFDGGHIQVVYDTAFFENNIANTGLLEVSLCPAFQNGSYDIYFINNATNTIIDIISGIDYGYALQRVLLDSTPKPFLHLAFAVKSDTVSHGCAFQTVSASSGNNPTYTTSADAPFYEYYDFDNIIHLPSDTFEFPSHHFPIILEKDTEPKIAGVGDTLTFRGLNFGDNQGDFLFKAADDGGQNPLLGLDDQYYLTWNDTFIKVIVPSLVYKGYENAIEANYCSGGAGSGFVKIINSNGDTNQNNAINFVSINYSVLNTKVNNTIKRIFLARQHCEYDFQFTLHQSLENDSLKISVIDSALHLWSRLTGLTLQLERNGNGELVFEDSTNIEGKNLIMLISSLSPNVMSTTRNVDHLIYNNNGRPDTILYRATGSNIRIQTNPLGGSWNYDFSGFVGNQYSFYQAFLHEIGHILLMGHVNDIAEVMYYSVRKNSNIIIPDTSSWAVKGVLANIEASRNINWPANSGLYPIGVRKPTISIADNKPPYICNGTSLTLQASPSGEQFSWSTGATTPSITVNNAGLYSVSLTDGGCTLSDSIFIGNSTLQATLSATNTNCPNDASGSISAQTTGNHPPFSYLWSGNGITPANTPQINNLLPGNYHLTLTDSVGCQTQFSQSITSTIGTLHVCVPFIYDCPLNVGFQIPNTPCSDPVFAVAYGGSPPYQYNWYYDDAGSTPPTNARSLSSSSFLCNVNIPFKKSLYIHVQDSCGQTAYLEIRPGMLQNNKKSTFVSWNVEIYPNPTTGNITIQSSESKIQKVEVYDIYGKLLKTTNANSIFTEINISDLAAGIYVARIITENGIKTKKFVKE